MKNIKSYLSQYLNYHQSCQGGDLMQEASTLKVEWLFLPRDAVILIFTYTIRRFRRQTPKSSPSSCSLCTHRFVGYKNRT